MADDHVQPDEAGWVSKEREKVIAYLASQQCEHAGVGDWPAFHIDPHIALWAVQSPTTLGRIGGWQLVVIFRQII